jgi:transcriptional regulator with XRE-family HTH domain
MAESENELGLFLKDRRARLDPAQFGLPLQRRRTPGLRREEVAQRAHVSATWYTWLEQGRGGAPSADVLDRLARALSLSPVEREHLFLLAQHRPPKAMRAEQSPITPQLQRVLDALVESPALLKTPEWTVLGWNRAARAVLANYQEMPPENRNLLRNLFLHGRHGHLTDWKGLARLIVGSVRRDLLRTGTSAETEAFIAELNAGSEDFREFWAAGDVMTHGAGSKQITHPKAGLLSLEFSTFAVDGYPDLGLVIFNPVDEMDREKMRILLAE